MWSFTINNYTSVPDQLPPNMKYLIVGEEVGQQNNTPHLQGYVQFKNPQEKPSQYFLQFGPQGHFEVSRGSPAANIEYCSKEGNFHEFGRRPEGREAQGHHGWKGGPYGEKGGEMEKAAYEEAWELAKKGDIEKISPRKRVRNYNTWVNVASRYPPNMPALNKLDNLWIMGPTGCGKSRWVHQMYPNCYRKLSTKWWQGYNPHNAEHKIVVLDDLHPDTWQDLPLLKQWADHYPFPAEIKGGSMIIRPERIIVTSNFHPRQCFRREEDLEPILRRFQVVDVADLPPPPPQMTDEERAAALLMEDVEEAQFNPPANIVEGEQEGRPGLDDFAEDDLPVQEVLEIQLQEGQGPVPGLGDFVEDDLQLQQVLEIQLQEGQGPQLNTQEFEERMFLPGPSRVRTSTVDDPPSSDSSVEIEELPGPSRVRTASADNSTVDDRPSSDSSLEIEEL